MRRATFVIGAVGPVEGLYDFFDIFELLLAVDIQLVSSSVLVEVRSLRLPILLPLS